MLVERQALEELHEVNNHQEELGGSGYSSRETPNRQTQMNKKERRKYPSLRSFTRSENLEKSEGQLLVEILFKNGTTLNMQHHLFQK